MTTKKNIPSNPSKKCYELKWHDGYSITLAVANQVELSNKVKDLLPVHGDICELIRRRELDQLYEESEK